MINAEDVARSVYVDSDITTQPTGKTDVPYVFLASNRGKVYELFTQSSEVNKKLVKSLNIKKNENGFLCGFFFLFRPNIFVKEYYSKFWTQILEDHNALVIGNCILYIFQFLKKKILNNYFINENYFLISEK
jgi:hypothetical protein